MLPLTPPKSPHAQASDSDQHQHTRLGNRRETADPGPAKRTAGEIELPNQRRWGRLRSNILLRGVDMAYRVDNTHYLFSGNEVVCYTARSDGTLPMYMDRAPVRIEFGMSYPEIAASMGKPSANAARMLVVRALIVLGSHLGQP